MRIIIEIPESEIPKQQDVIEIPFHFIDGTVCEVGGYGFDVLPKGHGRLKDENEIKQMIEDAKVKNESSKTFAENIIRFAPTIIEADKKCKEYSNEWIGVIADKK